MKKNIFVLLAIIFLNSALFATENNSNITTKLDECIIIKNEVLAKDIYTLKKIQGQFHYRIKISAIVLSNPYGKKNKTKGIIIDLFEDNGTNTRSNSSFLDIDELPNFISSIDFISKNSDLTKLSGSDYTEIIFTTKSGLKIGYYQEKKSTVFSGETYIEQTSFISSGIKINDVTCKLIDIGALSDIKSVIEKGIEFLNDK